MENATQIYNNMYNNDNLEQILNIYADKLIYFINNIINDINVAEDIMMDCFVEILCRKLKFVDEKNFKAYIYKTAKNKSINYIKKNKNIVKNDYDNFVDEQNNSIYFNETKNALLKIISSFKPLYKTVLYLYIFEEMNLEEIAKILEKSIRQVSNIKYRAIKKLKHLSKEFLNVEVL